MARKGGPYTAIGNKIARLAANQHELSQILGLTQQAISSKLTGKVAVGLKDLDQLSRHYNVPLIYFLSAEDVTPELARAWEKILLNGLPELHHTIEIASEFPRPFARQLLEIVRAMRETARYYTDPWARHVATDGQSGRAAEAPPEYTPKTDSPTSSEN